MSFSAYFDVIYHVIGDDISDKITNYRIYTDLIIVYIYKHFFSQLLIFGEKTGQIGPKTYPALLKKIYELTKILNAQCLQKEHSYNFIVCNKPH